MNYLQYKKHYSQKLVVIFLTLILVACSENNKYPEIKKAPAYINADLQNIGELPPYKIQVGDTIEIKFLYNEEFNQEIIVRPDGVISTAAAQTIKAAGRTPEELKQELILKYKEHLLEPTLSVLVKSYEPTRIYVLGEVKNPGEYTSVTPNPSLLQILARAGDIKVSAQSNQILIIRKNSVNKPTFYIADYNNVTRGINPLSDIQLASNDVIFIPRTKISNIHKYYDQYIKQFITPSIGYSLNNY